MGLTETEIENIKTDLVFSSFYISLFVSHRSHSLYLRWLLPCGSPLLPAVKKQKAVRNHNETSRQRLDLFHYRHINTPDKPLNIMKHTFSLTGNTWGETRIIQTIIPLQACWFQSPLGHWCPGPALPLHPGRRQERAINYAYNKLVLSAFGEKIILSRKLKGKFIIII